DLDQRIGDRFAVLVKHATGDDDALTDRFVARPGVAGQVGVLGGDDSDGAVGWAGASCLRDGQRDIDQRLSGSAQDRRAIFGIQVWWEDLAVAEDDLPNRRDHRWLLPIARVIARSD